jgi:hypothetical protein
MPKLVSELAQGNTFSRSSDGGALADSATRVFKIILNTPDEAIDIFAAIGVNIGDVYSANNPIPCVSVEGRADGESRLVRIVTAQYRSSAGVGASGGGGGGGGGSTDPKATAPDLRFASFSVSTSYMEMPAWTWIEDPSLIIPAFKPAINSAGDMYDGVTRYEPVVNFTFKQFEVGDPTSKIQNVGQVNSNSGTFGSLSLFPRSTLFKACNIEQHVESWGGLLYRGYMVSYEFAFRRNTQSYSQSAGAAPTQGDIGWDIAVPQTGFNVRAFTPNLVQTTNDNYGQPLRHGEEGSQYDGRIEFPLSLPDGVSADDKVRAMVKVFSYKGGGVSQTPSAQPVALNDDGTPRSPNATPRVLVYRRGQHDEFNFATLNLRLPF